MKLPIFKLSTVMIMALLAMPKSAVATDATVATSPFHIEQFTPQPKNNGLYKDYRKKWTRLSGFELSSLHWHQFVSIFANQSTDIYRHNYLEYLRTTQDDYDEDEEEEDEQGNLINRFKAYSPGTIIAKEGFDSTQGKPGTPMFIVLMKKHPPGYDPNNGDWEYMKFATDGKTLLQGKASKPEVQAQCAGCHINVAARDYIFSSFFSGKPD